jgi:hypothetical protein
MNKILRSWNLIYSHRKLHLCRHLIKSNHQKQKSSSFKCLVRNNVSHRSRRWKWSLICIRLSILCSNAPSQLWFKRWNLICSHRKDRKSWNHSRQDKWNLVCIHLNNLLNNKPKKCKKWNLTCSLLKDKRNWNLNRQDNFNLLCILLNNLQSKSLNKFKKWNSVCTRHKQFKNQSWKTKKSSEFLSRFTHLKLHHKDLLNNFHCNWRSRSASTSNLHQQIKNQWRQCSLTPMQAPLRLSWSS